MLVPPMMILNDPDRLAALDRISDAFYALDRSWRFVYLNAHCDNLLQRPREELLGACIWDAFPEATATALFSNFRRAFETGATIEFELLNQPLDRWFEVRVYPSADGLSVYFRDVSERRRNEASLRALRDVVEASTDAIIGTDSSTRITSWNAAAEAIYGYTTDDVIGQPVSMLVPEGYWTDRVAIRRAIEAGKAIRDVQMRHIRSDGHVVDVSVTVAPIFNANGVIVGSSATVRDITEHLRTIEALRDAERRYRTLVENSPAVTYTEEVGTGIVYASPQVLDLSGYTREEICSRSGFWLDAVHPDDLERVMAEVERADVTFEPFAVDMRVYRKDGRLIWVHNRGALHRDNDGVPLYWQGFLLDITDRVRAEEERARVADTLRAVIDASPLAIMATDGHGTVLMWNPTAERLFGWSSDEVLGKPVPLFPPLSGDEAIQRLAVAMRGEPTHGFETQRLHKDGSLIDVSISSAPIRDASGAITGSMAMYLDIRDAKQAHARLHDAERTLRSLVEQSPGVLYRTPPDSLDIVTYISPQLEALTGWTVQEVIDIGDGWFDLGLHPDDINLVRSTYHDACTSGTPFHIEYRVRTRAGDDVWVQDEAHLVRDENGTPLFWDGLIIDIDRRKRLEDELRHHAFHDVLTGLPNRFLLVERTERAMARSRRGGPPAAILFLDLDQFKVVNDSLGHGHGDAVLVEVARRLTMTSRDADTVARFGGDEFAVLLTEIDDLADAVAVAERVKSVLQPPVLHAGRQINLTTSIGVALYDADVEDPDDLLRRADVAMYRAKTKGRNQIAVFDAILHQVAMHRLETETDLRRAIAEQQFELHFQPTIMLESGEIAGFEALVRWNHPTRGLVPPAEFIPLAEESGLIAMLGQWILDSACWQAVEWGRDLAGVHPLTISVNLSPRQFQQADLVSQVEQTLQATGLAPACLTIEITETAVMEDIEITVKRLHALKALGVKIAIDDFGTGYSSLAYLKRFPVDVLKIDRSFVSGLGATPVDNAIVSATITLAHTLGITVVAEGVETRDQRDRLHALGCDRAQGFFFSKPLSAEEAGALIVRNAAPVGNP